MAILLIVFIQNLAQAENQSCKRVKNQSAKSGQEGQISEIGAVGNCVKDGFFGAVTFVTFSVLIP